MSEVVQPIGGPDRELWREKAGDFYSDSIHVTSSGGIGINCGGTVIVTSLKQWHAALNELPQLRQERDDLQKRVGELIEFADDCLLCTNGLIGANSTKEHESYESNFNELIVRAASLRLPSFKESPDEV